MEKENHISTNIMEQCSNIKNSYQNDVWNSIQQEKRAFPEEVTKETCFEILEKMYNYYNWKDEESKGRNPMVRKKTRLKYFAILMYSWMKATPLNMMITNILNYYKREGEIWINNEMVPFNAQNRRHINVVINNLISDIDNILRFKIKNY